MRHILVKIAALLFIAWTLSLMINTETKAQGKKSQPGGAEISTIKTWV